MNESTTADFGGDYRQHPDSRTNYAPPKTQPIYTCAVCGWWTLDGRYFMATPQGTVCADRAACARRAARRALEVRMDTYRQHLADVDREARIWAGQQAVAS